MTTQAAVDISRAEVIKGWMSSGELLWLASKAAENDFIVEFGCFHGRSTRVLADHCKGRVWAVDPWNGDYPSPDGDILKVVNTYIYPEFHRNLEDHIKSGRVIPHRGFSYSFKLPYQVDMVFIDGDHRYETVIKDINKALELVKPGGIISGHDYGHPLWYGVADAVKEKFGSVDTLETIWWIQKS